LKVLQVDDILFQQQHFQGFCKSIGDAESVKIAY